MDRIRLVTPCCGAPILARPFQCMHEYHAWRAERDREQAGQPSPSCWVGARPRDDGAHIEPRLQVPLQGRLGL